ncbi:hypothetical protein [Sporosarcina sp. FA15]
MAYDRFADGYAREQWHMIVLLTDMLGEQWHMIVLLTDLLGSNGI